MAAKKLILPGFSLDALVLLKEKENWSIQSKRRQDEFLCDHVHSKIDYKRTFFMEDTVTVNVVFMTVLLSPTHCSHIGDEWLVTVDDTESYIPDVTEVSSQPVTTFTRFHPLSLTTGSCQGGQPDNSEGPSVLCGSGSDWRQREASARPQGGENWTQDLLPPSRYVHVYVVYMHLY